MADSVKIDCLPNADAAEDLTPLSSSLNAAMRDWMADSDNMDCWRNVDAAEDLTFQLSSLSAVIRNCMAESDNADRAVKVFMRVVFHNCTEPNVSIRETSGNEN